MLYLSEIIGKRIVDQEGNSVARIRDVVAELVAPGEDDPTTPALDDEGAPIEYDIPVIKGLIARTGRTRQPFYLPIEQVQTLGRDGARIRSYKLDVRPFERREGEMLLTRDVWDKQVIDLERR